MYMGYPGGWKYQINHTAWSQVAGSGLEMAAKQFHQNENL